MIFLCLYETKLDKVKLCLDFFSALVISAFLPYTTKTWLERYSIETKIIERFFSNLNFNRTTREKISKSPMPDA
jgi:hypothetical protein